MSVSSKYADKRHKIKPSYPKDLISKASEGEATMNPSHCSANVG